MLSEGIAIDLSTDTLSYLTGNFGTGTAIISCIALIKGALVVRFNYTFNKKFNK
jgi:hypothetical protein